MLKSIACVLPVRAGGARRTACGLAMAALALPTALLLGGCPGMHADNAADGDFEFATMAGVPVELALSDGEATASPRQVEFEVLTGPAVGELEVRDADQALIYTPPEAYEGDVEITGQLHSVESTLGPVRIIVHVVPRVEFRVEPRSGERDLTVTAQAHRLDGRPIPDATLTWGFDQEQDTGPVSTHAQVQHTFRRGGRHAVTLAITLAGMTQPIACRSGDGRKVEVTVAPVIVGQVLDAQARPLAGAAVFDEADPERRAVTDAEGRYVLTVPFGWRGTLRAEHEVYAFVPATREFSDVTGDRTGEDFTVAEDVPGPGGGDLRALEQRTTVDGQTPTTITLHGEGPADEALFFLVTRLPRGGALSDPVDGRVIDATDLPYLLPGSEVVFTPDEPGQDAFEFRVAAGESQSTAAEVTLEIVGAAVGLWIDDCPLALVVAEEGEAGQLEMSASREQRGGALSWSVRSNPEHGTAEIDGSPSAAGELVRLTYVPEPGFTGTDLLSVAVIGDPQSAEAVCQVSVSVGGVAISGRVTSRTGAGVPGVTVNFTGIGSSQGKNYTCTTGSSGTYSRVVPIGWSGRVGPSADNRFVPAYRELTQVTQAVPNQNFTTFRNYYVAPDGDDAGPGTYSRPLATLQKGADRAEPGDTIYLRAGTYTARCTHFARSGAAGAPIRVEGFPGEVVTLTSGSTAKAVFDFTAVEGGGGQAGFGYYEFRRLKIRDSRNGWWIQFPFEGLPLPQEQAKAIHHVVIEDCEIWNCEAAFKARYAGVAFLTARRVKTHHCTATEGGWDIGEWPDNTDHVRTPRSASHDLLFEDCDSYENNINQQANGWVFQPTVYNVTFRRCRAWNNGKYGFACKGSGTYRMDRCAGWGNGSSQMYARGMATLDDGTPRPPYINDFRLTNCVFIAPADQRGGAALIQRDNSTIEAYNCTLLGLREGDYGQAGGYTFMGQHHEVTVLLKLYNCVIAGLADSNAMRLFDSRNPPSDRFMAYQRNESDYNLYFAECSTKFKYQKNNWTGLGPWQTYWAAGEPDGDDGPHGPTATRADAHSVFGNPQFKDVSATGAPLIWHASDNFLNDHTDIRLRSGSPGIGLGQNLSSIPELRVDYAGQPRPASGAWNVGAFQQPQ